MDQCDAQGMMLKLGDHVHTLGRVPQEGLDYGLLSDRLVDGIATSDNLEAIFAGRGPIGSDIAGAAMMELSKDGEDWMILFREAFEETIRWAGKPDKRETRLQDGSTRLSPRGSFALWREERRGRSKPFTATDREMLRITRRALFAINSLDRERAAVAARSKAEAEEARLRLVLLDSARNRSMGELAAALAHELNQPLSAVTNYVNACRQELRNYGTPLPANVGRLMDNAVAESSRAADLVRRLRNFIGQGEIVKETIDLHAVMRSGVELALVATGDVHPSVVFDFDPEPAADLGRSRPGRAGGAQSRAQQPHRHAQFEPPGADHRDPARRELRRGLGERHRLRHLAGDREDAVRAVPQLDHQRHGHRPVAVPLHRRGAWRSHLDPARALGRIVPVHPQIGRPGPCVTKSRRPSSTSSTTTSRSANSLGALLTAHGYRTRSAAPAARSSCRTSTPPMRSAPSSTCACPALAASSAERGWQPRA